MSLRQSGWLVLVCATLVACAGSSASSRPAESSGMTPQAARQIVSDFARKYGGASSAQPDPTSMSEVLEILLSDQVARFEGAARYLEGKQGGDVLSIRALIELSWGDAYYTVMKIDAELSRRMAVEVKRIADREASGHQPSEAERASRAKLESQINEGAKVQEACKVLADEHVNAGGLLAQEALKQSPPTAGPPRTALAFYYGLKADWIPFDDAMDAAKKVEPDAAMIQYLRSLESIQRYNLKPDARKFLLESMRIQPRLVRAQAKLVLLQDDVDGMHAELAKLKDKSPQHPVVLMLGKMVTEEYESATALRQATGK
jgi:hypothetical protein